MRDQYRSIRSGFAVHSYDVSAESVTWMLARRQHWLDEAQLAAATFRSSVQDSIPYRLRRIAHVPRSLLGRLLDSHAFPIHVPATSLGPQSGNRATAPTSKTAHASVPYPQILSAHA